MSAEANQVQIAKADAMLRVKRFASLRAAQRALAPSLRTPVTSDQLEEARYLRLRVQRLLADVQSGKSERSDDQPGTAMHPEAELAILDAQLDRFARDLAAQLGEIKVAQLRATLSVETAAARGEAVALLDLCLESEPVPDRFLHHVDYLLTMLSTALREGRWVVATDPADVSERVRQRCWAAASGAPRFQAGVIEQLGEAIRQLQGAGDVRAVMSEVGRAKTANAEHLFVPELLRCVVAYNVAVRNRHDAAIQRVREQDDAIDRETLIESREVLRDPTDSAEPDSVAEAVKRVQAVARKQASGESSAPIEGPLGKIATAFRAVELGQAERMAFAHAADDGIMNTVRRTVVLGFLQRSQETLQQPLGQLGITPAGLDALVEEFAAELQSEIDGLVVGNSYNSARQLSEIRSTHLSSPAGQRREKGVVAPDPRPPVPAQRRPRHAREFVAADSQKEHSSAQPEPVGNFRRYAWIAPTLVLGLVLLFRPAPSGPGVVEPLSRARLQVVSRMLESGYRDDVEDRAIFVGTLKSDWSELPQSARKRATDRIHDELRRKGVYEVLLYDGDLELQAHYVANPARRQSGWGSEKPRTP